MKKNTHFIGLFLFRFSFFIFSHTLFAESKFISEGIKKLESGDFAGLFEYASRYLENLDEELKLPVIENNVLQIYTSHGDREMLLELGFLTALNQLPENEKKALLQQKWPEIYDLDKDWFIIIPIEPEAPYEHFFIAKCMIKKENYAEALNHLNKALFLYPGFSWAMQVKAYILTKLGRLEEAEEYLFTVLLERVHPDILAKAALMRALSFIWIENKEYEKAEGLLWELLLLEPENENAINELNYIYQSQNIDKFVRVYEPSS